MSRRTIIIKNFTYGRVAASRLKAKDILEQEKINFHNERIIFDFQNIEVASHSFVDELLGPYIEEIGVIPENIKFKNCNEYVREQIEFVIKDRIKKP